MRTCASGVRRLRHLVLEVAAQPQRAVVDERGDQRVLGAEVAVEGVVRQPGGGDDVGDPRAATWCRTPA